MAATLAKISDLVTDARTTKTPDSHRDSNGSPLSTRATLAAASLSEATRNSTFNSTDSYLPGLKVEDNKTVQDERSSLLGLAHSKLGNAADEARFASSVKDFEARSDKQGLTPTQVADTYKNVEKILDAGANSPFTPKQQAQLAKDWMAHLADPTGKTRQGWHDTCALTFLETRLLSKDPDKISAKFAEVVSTSAVTTIDSAKRAEMEKLGTTGPVPLKVLQLDKASLQPDQEAQGLSKHADARTFADQIAQVMEGNLSWDSKTTDPKGNKALPGTMHYHQSETIVRPSDVKPGGKSEDKSGESITYIDPKTKSESTYDANGAGFGGTSSSSDIGRVNEIITGRAEHLYVTNPTMGDQNSKVEYSAESLKEFKDQLHALKDQGQLPFGMNVQGDKPGVMEDWLKRDPEMKKDDLPSGLWHSIGITDINEKGDVKIYNPWGINKTLPASELYDAMIKKDRWGFGL